MCWNSLSGWPWRFWLCTLTCMVEFSGVQDWPIQLAPSMSQAPCGNSSGIASIWPTVILGVVKCSLRSCDSVKDNGCLQLHIQGSSRSLSVRVSNKNMLDGSAVDLWILHQGHVPRTCTQAHADVRCLDAVHTTFKKGSCLSASWLACGSSDNSWLHSFTPHVWWEFEKMADAWFI